MKNIFIVIFQLLFLSVFSQDSLRYKMDTDTINHNYVEHNHIVYSNSIFNENIDTLSYDNGYKVTHSFSLDSIGDNDFYDITDYFNNGKKKEHHYEKSDGEYTGADITYYENGQIKSICNYIDGRIVGIYFEFYESEKIKIIGHYKNIRCLDEIQYQYDTTIVVSQKSQGLGTAIVVAKFIKQEKTGLWLFFDEKGAVIRKENY